MVCSLFDLRVACARTHERHDGPGANLFETLQAAAGSSAVWQGGSWLQLFFWLFEGTAWALQGYCDGFTAGCGMLPTMNVLTLPSLHGGTQSVLWASQL